MSKSKDSDGLPEGFGNVKKGGFQPINEGYQPQDRRGFSPTDSQALPPVVPTPPVTGGTATVTPSDSSNTNGG
jgi:hypothetical protein